MSSKNIFTKIFSDDGYIINQDLMEGNQYQYRGCPSSYNGCGWIAAYNLLHANNINIYFDTVRLELDKIHSNNGWPTPEDMLEEYIKRKGLSPEKVTTDTISIIDIANKYNSGIFQYNEDGTPHYVAFVKTSPNIFRFFNVGDYFTDKEMTMEKFARDHFIANNSIYALFV